MREMVCDGKKKRAKAQTVRVGVREGDRDIAGGGSRGKER